MTTIHSASSLIQPVLISDPMAMVTAELEQSLQQQDVAAHHAQRAAQAAQQAAVTKQVGEMREQADMQLAAAIAGAVTDLVKAGGDFAKADAGMQAGEAEGLHDSRAKANATASGERATGYTELGTAGGGALQGVFQRQAGMAGAAATEAGATADRARQAAEEAHEGAQSAQRFEDKVLDHAAQIAEARAQASLAATRA